MNAAVRRIILDRGIIDPAAAILRKYGALGASSLLHPDFNPNRVAQSGLGRLWQFSTGISAVAAVADTIGLVFEESQGAAITVRLNDDCAALVATGWTLGTGFTQGTGVLTGTAVGVGVAATSGFAAVVGRTYRLSYTVLNYSAGGVSIGIGGVNGIVRTANGSYVEFITAISTAVANISRRTTDFTGDVDNILVEEIAGNHANQATTNSRGTLRQVGDRFVWRGDGTDDNLLTTLVPAASMTMIVACKFDAASDFVIGSRATSTTRCQIQTSAAGILAGGVGAHDSTTILDVAAEDIRTVPGVAALRFDGTTVSLFWKPMSGVIRLAYQGAQSGVPNTTIPLRLGADNNNGTAAGPLNGDIYAALAIPAAISDAEIAAVAERFSRP